MYRQPKQVILLLTPFIVTVIIYLIVRGLTRMGNDDTNSSYVEYAFSYIFVLVMLLCFTLCSGLYILTFVSDRELKLRAFYHFLGLRSTAYLLGNLLADFCLFLIGLILFIASLFLFKMTYLTVGWAFVILTLSCFGFSLITLTYLSSFAFTSAIYAFNKIGMWFLILGLLLPMVLFLILAIFNLAHLDFSYQWVYAFLIDPFWALASNLFYALLFARFFGDFSNPLMLDKVNFSSNISYTGILSPWVAMLVMLGTGLVWLLLTLIMDAWIANRYRKPDGREYREH